jgi:hypothetical protein
LRVLRRLRRYARTGREIRANVGNMMGRRVGNMMGRRVGNMGRSWGKLGEDKRGK